MTKEAVNAAMWVEAGTWHGAATWCRCMDTAMQTHTDMQTSGIVQLKPSLEVVVFSARVINVAMCSAACRLNPMTQIAVAWLDLVIQMKQGN